MKEVISRDVVEGLASISSQFQKMNGRFHVIGVAIETIADTPQHIFVIGDGRFI
jgi:hypothetical protein